MTRARHTLLALLLVAVPASARAGEDPDVDLIPKEVMDEPAEAPRGPTAVTPRSTRADLHGAFSLEQIFTGGSETRDLVVSFPATVARWQNRTSFDAAIHWNWTKHLTLTLSDRVDLLEQDGQSIVSRQALQNAFREGYASWEPMTRTYLEAGRINVRNGVALGFNPTDFFRTRTLVGQASLDPSVIRRNRLGTLMVRAQTIWSGGSTAIAFAPKLYTPSLGGRSEAWGIDPRFDATNSAARLLCTMNLDVAGLSPQALAYFELGQSKLGFSMTRQLGDSVIAYAEWTGGVQSNLLTRATAYGKSVGALPMGAAVLPPTSTAATFQTDAAVGGTWSSSAAKISLSAEYHFHHGGLSPRDWRNWFDIGAANQAASPQLWYVRGFANEQQEPAAMHQVFFRADWPRALLKDLEVSGFAFISLQDGSTLAQIAATYFLSDRWTVAGYATANIGADRSERGSSPQAASGSFQLILYL